MNAPLLPPLPAVDRVQAAFADALSRIQTVARFRFRDVRCSDTREDAVCETVALCWVWYLSLVQKGRNPAAFVTALAQYGATAVQSGRRACGQEKAGDVLSRRCQRRRRLCVSSLPGVRTSEANVLEESLRHNTRTPILDQVQFRCDFPEWKGQLPERRRALVDAMALGHRTKDLAELFRISSARVSQCRRELGASWRAFCGDDTSEVGEVAK